MNITHTLSLFCLLAIVTMGRVSAQPHLFFLHNRFIEEEGTEATHPEYGNGHYHEILAAFRDQGFTVHSELRPPGTDVRRYARRIVAQIDSLLASGVPAAGITVVGTSKGGYIAQYVSTYLANPAVNFVFIGCYRDADLQQLDDIDWCGNILTIYEASDAYGVSARARQQASRLEIPRFQEVELHTGLGHGFLFLPLDEWMLPAAQWARQQDNSAILMSVQPDLQQPFRDCGFKGSITVFDYKQGKWITSDSTDSRLETVPASTFKIPNLLIALERGVIDSEMDTVGWVGSIDTALYGYRPSTYRDMTVRHAFEVSAGWVFMELAKKVGRQRYEQVLRAICYGNAAVSDNADFWNFGPLKVAPRDQVQMLVNVYEEKLPFSKRNLDILKDVMVTERTSEYTIRSKTGWGVQDGKDIGWWVGYLQREENVYFFVTRITKASGTPSGDFMKCRLDITKAVLRQLGAL